MSADEHLTITQLRAYVRGALHPSTLVATDDHLEACEACREALAGESGASFGAEAFGRALAAAEARPESPHLAFDHLRGVVDGTLPDADREWADAHVALCVMCAEELRDLERFAATLPANASAEPVPAPGRGHAAPPAAAPAPVAQPPLVGERTPARVLLPRVSSRTDGPGEPPARFGERPPVRLPFWSKAVAALSLAALVQLWAC